MTPKHPWDERHLYDRITREGYYRNAFDTKAARRLLLDPTAPDGSGRVVLCCIDPVTQEDHSSRLSTCPTTAFSSSMGSSRSAEL